MWLALASPARATVYTLTHPDDAVFGEDQTVVTVYEDTLYDLARKYSLGSEELIRVNPGVDPWLPGAGKVIVIPGRHILPPGPHEGIVVNLPEHRLYYYPKPKRGQPQEVITYPVSIGKMDWRTPLGLTHVISKQKDPTWFPPASVRKEHAEAGDPLPASVPPGPDNPLGAYAMRLAAGNGTYLIHGTNNPIAVGLAVTHGCIRMYPDDVAALFPLVPVGTPVRLINVPIKVAWVDGELLLEAHPPVDAEGQSFEPNVDQFSELLQKAVGDTTSSRFTGTTRARCCRRPTESSPRWDWKPMHPPSIPTQAPSTRRRRRRRRRADSGTNERTRKSVAVGLGQRA
jgi:L,D-transpeptidase ErfK/SrfK